MEGRWSGNLVQRENSVADTGTGRVSRKARTNAASQPIIGEWKGCEDKIIPPHAQLGNELPSASLMTSRADPSMLPTRSVLTLCDSDICVFISALLSSSFVSRDDSSDSDRDASSDSDRSDSFDAGFHCTVQHYTLRPHWGTPPMFLRYKPGDWNRMSYASDEYHSLLDYIRDGHEPDEFATKQACLLLRNMIPGSCDHFTTEDILYKFICSPKWVILNEMLLVTMVRLKKSKIAQFAFSCFQD
ncbi:hypothetical protein BLNAU_3196 [Blattamonas nauphoetae]|uniref:Uncharacterized protein n=1 Tax=Blattamonas nauphoetae TaxID=2049346 RepID=A0ABQ9YDU3_9EUKA|nr:hypothetical protein BLNAU_3196 [Blattamonas nauphoetae]